MYSSLSVKDGAIEMTAIIIIINRLQTSTENAISTEPQVVVAMMATASVSDSDSAAALQLCSSAINLSAVLGLVF